MNQALGEGRNNSPWPEQDCGIALKSYPGKKFHPLYGHLHNILPNCCTLRC